jgi:hypothetical protein
MSQGLFTDSVALGAFMPADARPIAAYWRGSQTSRHVEAESPALTVLIESAAK